MNRLLFFFEISQMDLFIHIDIFHFMSSYGNGQFKELVL